MIFLDLQQESFRWHNFSARRTPYADLLACCMVCKGWAALVPHILYQDLRLSTQQLDLMSWIEGNRSSHPVRLPSSLGQLTLSTNNRVCNIISTLSIDLRCSSDTWNEPALQHGIELLALCPQLRRLALHLHSPGYIGEPDMLAQPGDEMLERPSLTDAQQRQLLLLTRVVDLRLSCSGPVDLEHLLHDLLRTWPAITGLDISICRFPQSEPRRPSRRSWTQMRGSKLEHLRADAKYGWLIRALSNACKIPTSIRTAFISLSVHSYVDFLHHTAAFSKLTTLHILAATPTAALRQTLSGLFTLRSVILGTCSHADVLLAAVPDHIEQLGIEFLPGFCVSIDEVAGALRTRLVHVNRLDIYVSEDPRKAVPESAQVHYRTRLQLLCGPRGITVTMLPKVRHWHDASCVSD